MLPETTAEAMADEVVDRTELKERAARLLGAIVFFALVALIPLTAIPYGTAEAWWKAAFICAIFALAIPWTIEGYLTGSWISEGRSLLLPLLALAALALIQTLPVVATQAQAGSPEPARTSLSFDPYQTKFFLLQFLALVIAGVLLQRYAATERRLRILIATILLVAVATGIFGIVRQTMQHHGESFILPFMPPPSGYGQFVNRNHFAFLMEMGFGLALGMILGGGVRKEHVLIYFAALLPIWTALVMCGSRGGIIAMLAQVVAAALLFSFTSRTRRSEESKLLRIVQSLPVRVVLLVVLISGVVIGSLLLGGDRLASRLEQSHDELTQGALIDRTGVRRDEVWRLTLKMFAANPIVGVGMGAYWTAVPTYHDASGTMTPQEAHNDYLELLASGGIVGMALGVWFAVLVFRRIRDNLRSTSRFHRAAVFGAAIAIVGVAVHSLFDFGLHMIVNALVFTTLIVMATSKPRPERVLVGSVQ